jgi:hypothetical protein
MTHRSDNELKSRNGHTLVVGIIARISGCVNQKEISLDDQVDHAKEVVNTTRRGDGSAIRRKQSAITSNPPPRAWKCSIGLP